MGAATVNLYTLTIANPANGERRVSQVFASSTELAQTMALRDPTEVVSAERAAPFTESVARLFFSQKCKISHLRQFYAAMSRCLEIDRSILRALEMTIPTSNSPSMRFAAAQMLHNLKAGLTPSESLRALEGVTPPEHIIMLKAGDQAGQIPQVFATLAEDCEKADKSISAIKTAMIYPACVFLVGYGATILASLFLVPQLQKLFSSFKADLPPLTAALFSFSGFIRAYPIIIVALAGLPIYLLVNLSTVWQSEFVQSIVERLPLVRKLVFRANMAKCLSTLSMLLSSKVKFQDALELTASVSTQPRITKFFTLMRADVLAGATQFEAANNHRGMLGHESYTLMPMIQLGEKNGNLQSILKKVGEDYQEDVDATVKNIDTILTPLTLIVVGVFVCMLAVAIYMPILKLNNLMLPSRH